jgi:signal transduction histidine kinase/ligand-binding sensor domain-containing protein
MEGISPYLPLRRAVVFPLRLIGVLLLLQLCCRAAVEPTQPEYHLRTWTTEDGLPHNSASRIIQDHAGFLWFATLGGLARFDGREFRELPVPPEQRPRGFNIRALAEERPGTLLVLPTSGNLLRYSAGNWTVHPATSALFAEEESAADVHTDAKGSVWIVTARGRIMRVSPDGTAKFFAAKAAVGARFPRFSFAADGTGKTWVGSDSLLAVEQDGELQPHEFTPREPLLIASGRDGRIWVCTDGKLQRLERGRLSTECENVPWQGEFAGIRQVFEDSRGVLWITSSRRGLLRYQAGQFTNVPTVYPSVSFITEDREGNLWIGTDGRGVIQLREKSYRLYNTVNGLVHEVVSSLDEDSSGRVWLANRNGGLASVTANGALQPGGPPDFHSYANVVSVDALDRVWFGGGQSGLFRWDQKRPEPPLRLPLPPANLHVLFRAQNGDMWFAADPSTVGFYRGNETRVLTEADGLAPPRTIDSITQDRSGQIWLVDRNGELLVWNGKRVERFEPPAGVVPRPIHTIYPDGAGRLWLGTAGGLVLKDGDNFSLLTQAHGLADDLILQILEDDEERLWFAARRGLFYVEKSELLDAARGGGERVASHMFGRNQGLTGLSPTANYHPAARKARDGKLWFATSQGAVAIDPARLPRDLPPPPLLIDEVRLDGRLLPPGAMQVPSGQHRVEFRFAALSYTSPEDVMLRHQLEGADRQWTDTGTDRSASYTNLSPGNYRLRVIARNSTGRWNTTGATLAFTVVPAWWETWAFRASAFAVITALTAWLARTIAQRRLRERLQRVEQEHALEKERVRIARDLHDDLGASLTEVGLLADRLVDLPAADLAPQLTSLAWRTRRLSTDLSGIVWTMSPRNSTLDRLGEFIRQYAQRLFRGLPIQCSVRGADSLPPLRLAPDFQHQLIAATKEALNNVLKHSRASETIVELRYHAGCFEIVVSDNGGGFSIVSASGLDGNGLRNIRARIEEIGGEVEIASGTGEGTRVTLRLPLPDSPVATDATLSE